MSEHLVLFVDHLVRPGIVQSVPEIPSPDPSVPHPPAAVVDGSTAIAILTSDAAGSSHPAVDEGMLERQDSSDDEGEPLIQMAECRICQEEDCLKNFESPCACSGSLKYAHRKCVQHWCNEKGDIICEICHQPYQPGYTAPPLPPQSEESAIDIGGWTISGAPLELDPRLLAIAEAEHHFLESDYEESSPNANGAAFCRSAALILMALLLLRHALSVSDADGDDDDTTAFFSLFLLRAAGFLLPCYIMAWAISILQQRRQRQEAAALAATQVAFVLQSGQHRRLQFAIGSGPPVSSGTMVNSHQEAV